MLFFTSLQVILVFTSLEIMVLSAYIPKSLPWVQIIGQIIGLMAAAGLCYHVSLDKASKWGRDIRRVFDLQITEVFSHLGMDALKDLVPSDEKFKTNLKLITSWLAYGGLELEGGKIRAKADWYKAPDKPQSWPQS